jgi:hypothetical protein
MGCVLSSPEFFTDTWISPFCRWESAKLIEKVYNAYSTYGLFESLGEHLGKSTRIHQCSFTHSQSWYSNLLYKTRMKLFHESCLIPYKNSLKLMTLWCISGTTIYYIPNNVPCLNTVNFTNLWSDFPDHHTVVFWFCIITLWNWWSSGSVLSETDDPHKTTFTTT